MRTRVELISKSVEVYEAVHTDGVASRCLANVKPVSLAPAQCLIGLNHHLTGVFFLWRHRKKQTSFTPFYKVVNKVVMTV